MVLMKFSKQPAYINIESGFIYWSKLEIVSTPRHNGHNLMIEQEAIESIIKDCRKIIEQAEVIKQAAEIYKGKINQKTIF